MFRSHRNGVEDGERSGAGGKTRFHDEDELFKGWWDSISQYCFLHLVCLLVMSYLSSSGVFQYVKWQKT